jgi:hypothetical protein
MKMIEHLWRHDGGSEIIKASGCVCYLAFDRNRLTRADEPNYSWFRHGGLPPKNRESAERQLSKAYSTRLWRTYLRGQRHDYYFYMAFDTIEEFLQLVEVAKIMVS